MSRCIYQCPLIVYINGPDCPRQKDTTSSLRVSSSTAIPPAVLPRNHRRRTTDLQGSKYSRLNPYIKTVYDPDSPASTCPRRAFAQPSSRFSLLSLGPKQIDGRLALDVATRHAIHIEPRPPTTDLPQARIVVSALMSGSRRGGRNQ